jgi:hypothetical protein
MPAMKELLTVYNSCIIMFIKMALKNYELEQHLLHKYVHKNGFEKI